MVKKIGVLTSGGDSPGMNAAIRAVVRSGIANGLEVYGIENGYKGLYDNQIRPLAHRDVSDIMIRGGTILGSARLPDFKEDAVMDKAIDNLKQWGIEALVVIGGDGTYRGAAALTSKGVNCIGLPGTIDNDITTTEYTIGFDTALNTIIECVDKLRDTSASHHRCSIVEVMGNHCGDLALFAAISSGAEIVITPETGYDEVEVLDRLRYLDSVKSKRHAIIIISEKITDVEILAQKVSFATPFSGRSTVLGHIQRGGSPNAFDRVLATRMGDYAVKLLLDGLGGQCVGILNNRIVATSLEDYMITPKYSRKELYSLQRRLV